MGCRRKSVSAEASSRLSESTRSNQASAETLQICLCFRPGVFSFHSLMTAKKEFCLVEAPLRTGVFVRCPPPYSQKFIHMRSRLGTHNCACLFNGHTRRRELSVSNTTWNPAPNPSQLSHKGCPINVFIHVNINMLYPSF